MSPITISAIVLAIALAAMYISKCLLKTSKITITVLDEFGAEPVDIRMPGWSWIWWPKNTVHDVIPTDERAYNVTEFEMVCLVENGDIQVGSAHRQHGLGRVASDEISFGYRVKFHTEYEQRNYLRTLGKNNQRVFTIKEQLDKYYSLVKVAPDGTRDISRLENERIRDLIQSLFRKEVSAMFLFHAIKITSADVKHLRGIIEERFQEEALPLVCTDLSINNPFEPATKKLQDAISKRSEAALEMEAAVVNAEKDRKLAEIGIKTAEANAKAMLVSAEMLAKAWGIDKLPPEQQVTTFLKKEAIQAFRDIGSSQSTKILIGTNLMGEINSALGKVLDSGAK